MAIFDLTKHENYIVRTILKFKYSREFLKVVLNWSITSILKFHLSMLLCYWLTFGNFLDYLAPIAVSVYFTLSSNTIYRYVETHRHISSKLIDYLVVNYSLDNLLRWKRIILSIGACYLITASFLVNINSRLILISTLQTAGAYIICDIIENDGVSFAYHFLVELLSSPKVVKHVPLNIIEEYSSNAPPLPLT